MRTIGKLFPFHNVAKLRLGDAQSARHLCRGNFLLESNTAAPPLFHILFYCLMSVFNRIHSYFVHKMSGDNHDRSRTSSHDLKARAFQLDMGTAALAEASGP